jgi:hypothetical protein
MFGAEKVCEGQKKGKDISDREEEGENREKGGRGGEKKTNISKPNLQGKRKRKKSNVRQAGRLVLKAYSNSLRDALVDLLHNIGLEGHKLPP